MPPPQKAPEEDSEEDDYMTMILPTEAPKTESSLQRTQRLKREAAARGRPKSRAEIAEEEAQRREATHSRSLLEAPAAMGSKGLAMMAKMGFRGGALGKEGSGGVTEPIRVFVREGKGGLGIEEEKRKRAREAEEQAEREGKKVKKIDPGDYRARMMQERETERLERQYRAAARLAQQLGEAENDDGETAAASDEEDTAGMERELGERDRAAKRELTDSLSSRLPGYAAADEDKDPDYRMAMGKDRELYEAAEDLDEDDAELEEFEAQEPREKLAKVLQHLREEHNYCFWCKSAYPDASMDGCPGLTEEDHD
ncbi:unnamed protein product [Parascedosporium putredinis]|uniref:G-patch domain-containing protein n=1 Tax=Parascedosporium putredinis TaxID=1442378 RepID=A0A9P1H762_9PEZI|nr:unnamed protein product [Parascedosporium putredinis]CAI7998247.1 unnamed protein product [Parascedosporium putredinis]